MGEVHFMISEAAKRVEVETHVLRYWEEELELPIERTEMGHRYYTEENIQLFNCIKELKEQGMLLKELKMLIPDILKTKAQIKAQKAEKEIIKQVREELTEKSPETTVELFAKQSDEASEKQPVKNAAESIENAKTAKEQPKPAEKTAKNPSISTEQTSLVKAAPEVVMDDKLGQVQALIGDVVQQVVAKNNKVLEQSVSTTVSEKVLKEMNYLMQAKERQEEERYKKLDYLIRQQQTNRKESARLTPGKRLRKLLGDI